MKNILWGGLVILVLLLGAWFYSSRDNVEVVKNTDNTNNPDTTITPGTVTPGTNPATPGRQISFKGIFAEKGNYECKYEQVDPKFRSSNVIYLSNGKMRGEFRTTTASGSTGTMIVYDGSNLYVWKEGTATGVRTQPKSISELPEIIPKDLTSGVVVGTSPSNASYDCHPWSTKASFLVRPTGVTFN